MKVKLNSKASIFFDSKSRIVVKKGQTVELNVKQASSPLIKDALRSGFLVQVLDEKKEAKSNSTELVAKFTKAVESGVAEKKILKMFSLADFKTLAAAFEIEVEPNDTKETILKALLEEVVNDEGETEEEGEETEEETPETEE